MSMITSKSSSNQALPPLSSLMRDCVHPRPGRMEIGSEIEHEYHSFREGQPTVIEPSRLEAFQGRYPQHLLQQQQQQQHSSHLLLPTHNAMAPVHLPHAESHYPNVPEMEGIRYAMQISPISPRTRCPSLSESILSSTGCTSPGSHSPTTPVSERGAPAYGDGRGNATGSSYQHVQRNNHRYQQAHDHRHHQQHRISKSYQSSSVRIHGSISPHPLPMRSSLPGGSEHKKSKHEIRRIKHLNSEKKRRETIKDGMEALFKLVPECTDKGTSKANILKMTKEFIVELHEGTTSLQMEIRRLGKENEDMRRYIKQQQEPRKYTCRL